MSADLDRAGIDAAAYIERQIAARKETRAQRQRERYRTDPAYRAKRQEQSKNQQRRRHARLGAAERLYRASKQRAKREGLPFDLTLDYLRQLWPTSGECPVLGFRMTLDGERAMLPSLDRIDSDRGYVRGNVRIISYRANSLKSDSYKEELARVLAYLSSRDPLRFEFRDGDHLVEYVRGFEPLDGE